MGEKDREALEKEAEQVFETDTLPHGRYIPYSGGSMGWFENTGVLKSERGNNYRFSSAMESEYVRSALFQRWGQTTDVRASKRIERENSVNMLMSDPSAPESAYQMETKDQVLEGVTKDISHYGMRMQFTDPVELSKGDKVLIRLFSGNTSEPQEVLLELPATVVWIKKEVVVRPVWFVGVAFLEVTVETEQFLSEFLGT